MMLRKLLFVPFILSVFSAWGADADKYYVKVTDGTGDAVYFAFDEYPQVVVSDGGVVITAGSRQVSYGADEHLSFSFTTQASTGVASVEAQALRFELGSGYISVYGLKMGETAHLYSVSGLLEASAKADANGELTMTAPTEKGVHILTTSNKKQLKFIVK